MKRNWALKIVKFAVFAILFLGVVSFVVMHLWNWLVPPVFGWHVINYWQALGLLVLSKILFGGFRGRPHRDWKWRRGMMDRWEKMTPEEREKFRNSMRGRCGPFASPAVEPKA